MEPILVRSKDSTYPIVIERGLLQQVKVFFDTQKDYVLITDSMIPTMHYQPLLDTLSIKLLITLPAGEQIKTLSTYQDVLEQLITHRIKKDVVLLAFGGGVIGDFVGFLAATYLRGVSYIQIPTTLLSQVDSSVGGKVALDYQQAKNIIGQFYPPKAVFIDPSVLQTLPQRQWSNGMAEIIKMAAICDIHLFEKLESMTLETFDDDVIIQSILHKKHYVETDEFDQGIRQHLNFGHTFGHAIEAYYNYQKYTHGEAVAIGMMRITKNPLLQKRIQHCLIRYHLPIEDEVSLETLLPLVSLDKKATSKQTNVIVLQSIGQAKTISLESFLKEEIPHE